MPALFRWLLRIATALVAVALVAVFFVYYFASRSLPDYDKVLDVAELTAPVEIVRDNANVPHVFADADRDVFFGLGYAHAQDRLWQMTTLRRVSQGRMSEVFGTATLDLDKLLRRLDLHRLAQQSVADQDARTMEALEGYAAGVNARLAEINSSALGRGAPEMFLFNAPVAPWRPADSLAILKVMALQLSGHLEDEVLRARTALVLDDPARLQDILPDAPGPGTAALPEYSQLFQQMFPDLPRYAEGTDLSDGLYSPFPRRGLAGASNAWSAGPSRSATGSTLLANDPHLGFSAPTIWYLARLELEAGGVIGGTIPGIPTVLAGRSARLGWAITSSYLDDQDVYIEKLNPDDPEEYLTPDGYKRFRTRAETVRIKGAEPIEMTLRWTDNGPVLPGTHYKLGTITPSGHVTSVAWTALSPDDTTMTAAVGIMKAATVAEALDAAEAFVAPSQVLTVVDREHTGMKLIGSVPRRDPRHQSQGRLPTPGWRAENRWQGEMPFASNPGFVDPVGGILGHTNNKMVERPFPNHISFVYGDTQRINRWRRLMQAREVHTRESFIEAQLDTVSYTARSLLRLVAGDLWYNQEAAAAGTPERQRQDALKMLADWNGEMNEHLPEPLIYAAWMRALQERLIRDDLGGLADDYKHVDPVFIERVFRDIDGAGIWCDVAQSTAVETCPDMARLALDDALYWIGETYGQALESLRWGDAHQATHDHEVLGDVPLLRNFVNIRQSTSGGDNTLMRGRTSGEGPNPFLNVHGAGYRGVYDFADPDSSVFITATGQSGHFLSRHYDDLGQLWRRGEYIPMSLDQDLARAASVGVTVLQPAK
ncbi:penicillin acylase family protein [Chachezhania antarctica]|uniref:penicillin acylase family protein n=1 Tax=Chachezhania antarctica TaxID=2340860 RepID=UPI000EB4FAB8|nr:penicillin acylase family protein [Chachezhania antarctica]|tara:strand:- start:4099 stop:6576 length:2478 start_codon:yes stop_codon:yes gene_type:complete